MVHVIAPATTANLGAGFDSIGVALQLYNHLWVEEIPSGLNITVKNASHLVPTDKKNMIFRTISWFYNKMDIKLPGLNIIQEDHIPITRGLGSSATCTISALLAANELSGAGLSRDELLQMAALMEGHPDNSNPALLGEMVVGVIDKEQMV